MVQTEIRSCKGHSKALTAPGKYKNIDKTLHGLVRPTGFARNTRKKLEAGGSTCRACKDRLHHVWVLSAKGAK